MWTEIDGHHIMNTLHTYWWALVPCAALLGYVFRGRREYWYAN